MEGAKLNSVTRGTGANDPELIQATKEYNNLLEKQNRQKMQLIKPIKFK